MHPTAKQSLQALFSSLPTTDSADPAQTAQGFMMAIEGIPDQFVAEAAKRYIQGRVLRKSHTFLPTAPEFAIEARKCWDEARAAAYKPVALPPPEPSKNVGLSPDEIESRKAAVEALNAKLSAKVPDAPPRRYALTLDDELAMSRDRPLTVSSRFAALLQEQLTDEAAARQHRQYAASRQGDGGGAA